MVTMMMMMTMSRRIFLRVFVAVTIINCATGQTTRSAMYARVADPNSVSYGTPTTGVTYLMDCARECLIADTNCETLKYDSTGDTCAIAAAKATTGGTTSPAGTEVFVKI
ncbi:uncharacterized protein LOC141907589 [Tubulanus polymorphus]|uniref:uncharacterized protein LOC141907589 n=1 Tax=Tubulanus polymorphus TaxID=672921 RepID=UPI003DA40F17